MQEQIEDELTKEQQKELFVADDFVMDDEIYDNQFNCMDWFINDDYKARWIVHLLLSQNFGDNIEEALKDYRDYNKLKNLNSSILRQIVDDNDLNWLEDDYWYLNNWIETMSELTNKTYITKFVECYKEYDTRTVIIELENNE
tara:strand:- start:68 stop:496 length:429 start_codon:yes stop_codon:yes gene_type:complete